MKQKCYFFLHYSSQNSSSQHFFFVLKYFFTPHFSFKRTQGCLRNIIQKFVWSCSKVEKREHVSKRGRVTNPKSQRFRARSSILNITAGFCFPVLYPQDGAVLPMNACLLLFFLHPCSSFETAFITMGIKVLQPNSFYAYLLKIKSHQIRREELLCSTRWWCILRWETVFSEENKGLLLWVIKKGRNHFLPYINGQGHVVSPCGNGRIYAQEKALRMTWVAWEMARLVFTFPTVCLPVRLAQQLFL